MVPYVCPDVSVHAFITYSFIKITEMQKACENKTIQDK